MKIETFMSAQLIFAGFQAFTFVRPQHIPQLQKFSMRMLLPLFLVCLSLGALNANGISTNCTATGETDKVVALRSDNSTLKHARKLPVSVTNHIPGIDGNLSGSLALVRNLSEGKNRTAAKTPSAPITPAVTPMETEFNFSDVVSASIETNSFSPTIETSPAQGNVIFHIEISSEISTAAKVSVMQKSKTFYEEDIMLDKGRNRKAIDLSTVPKGNYWLKISTPSQTEMVKIIIQ